MKIPLSICVTLLFASVIIFPAHGKTADGQVLEKVRNVLLLNSYNQKMSWVEDIVQGVEDVLQPEDNDLTLHIENMDSKVFFSQDYFEAFRDYLQVKYRKTEFSLILSSDNNAYDFLRTYRDTLFPGVPVSFCGVNNFNPELIGGLTGFTGVAEIFSAKETAALALKLHPDTTEIYVVNDYLKTGRAWAKEIGTDLKEIEENIKVSHSGDLPISELQKEIANLSPGTVVLLGVYFSDKDGRYFTYERVGALLSEASKVPVYCLLEFNIGKGVVGGQVISGYYQGRTMAQVGERILNGQDVGSLPVILEGSNRNVFDYVQLQRFNLKEDDLPHKRYITNRPFSFYKEYKVQVWIVICFISVLLGTIIGLLINIRRRRQAESDLIGSEMRFRQLANATWEAVVVHEKGAFIHGNDQFYAQFGYCHEELVGKQVLAKIIDSKAVEEVRRRVEEGNLQPYESTAIRKDGAVFPVEIRVREMTHEGKELRMAAIRDLSERKRIEQQLSQTQKMEAIGTLAGGIAHDFNNILSAIIGYCELALMDIKPNSTNKNYLSEILTAGNRAKELVTQILTFARKSGEEKEPIQVSLIVEEALKLLRASLPTSITIVKNIDSQARVWSDTTKIHQIMMNLGTNSGKAMKDGGVLTVTLDKVNLDEEFVTNNMGSSPGQYLKLMIKDTGVGISSENIGKIFDPFFTTRSKDEGTGLGLSVVHGVVKDCKGFLTVASEVGKGCEINVYLPVIDIAGDLLEQHSEEMPSGNERILLVDDELLLVNLMSDVLRKLGYTVTGVTNSLKALHMFTKSPESFDLVISDMTMPLMTGDQLASKLLAVRGDIPIILNTGYTDRITEDEAIQKGVKKLVMKPVAISKLAVTIREALSA